jgi:hypothetical protein
MSRPFRDLGLWASIPSLEKAGLFSFVPLGHKTANFRKAVGLLRRESPARATPILIVNK